MVGQWYPDRLCGLRTGSGLKLREERALLLWGHLRDVSLKKTSRPQIWGLSGGWRPSHIPSVDLEPEALFTHKDLRHHTLLPWSCSPDLENSLSEVIPHQARKIKARNYLSNSPYVESPNPVSSLQLSLQNYQFERARGKEAGQVTSNGGRKQQASARGLLGEVRFRCRPEAIGRGDPRVRQTGSDRPRRSSGPPCRTRDRTGHPAGGEPRSEGTRQKKKPEGARRLHRPDSIPNPLDKKRNCVSGLAEGDPSSVSCLKK